MPLINGAAQREMDERYIPYNHNEMRESEFGEVFGASMGLVIDEELSISSSLNREGWSQRKATIDNMIRSEEVENPERYKIQSGPGPGRSRGFDYEKIATDLKRPDIKTDEQLTTERNATLRNRRNFSKDIIERGSGMAQFLGAMNAYMVDPVNLLTIGIAVPAAAAKSTSIIGRAVLTARNTALIEGATELGIQSLVYNHKQDIESPYSASDALTNIAMAATGAGILGGVAGGLSGWFQKVREVADELPETAELKTAKEYIQRQEQTLKGAPEAGGIANLEKIKTDVIEEAKAELIPLAGEKITRGELKSLRTEKQDLEYRLSKLKKPTKEEVKIELERVKKTGAKGGARKVKRESQSIVAQRYEQDKSSLQDKLKIVDSKIANNQQAINASSDLAKLERGVLPERYQKIVDSVAHEMRVKSDVEYLKEMDARATQYAPPSKTKAIYEPPPSKELDPPAPNATASQREMEILKAQGLDQVYNKEVAKFNTIENPKVQVGDELVDANDLIKQFDDEIKGLDEVLKCAYG